MKTVHTDAGEEFIVDESSQLITYEGKKYHYYSYHAEAGEKFFCLLTAVDGKGVYTFIRRTSVGLVV